MRVGYDSDEFCRVRDGGDGNANAIVDETLIQKSRSIGRPATVGPNAVGRVCEGRSVRVRDLRLITRVCVSE